MVPSDRRTLWIAVGILAATLLWLPWAAGGRSLAGQAGVVLLLTVAGAAGLCARGPHATRALRWMAPVGILIGASAAQTVYPDRTAQALLLLAAYVLAFAVALRGARTAPQVERVLLGTGTLSGLVVVVLGLVWLSRGNDGGFYANALVGPFGYPNALAGFLLLTGGAAAATLPTDRSRLERGLALVTCGACVIGLYFTGSRGVWVAVVAGVLFWAFIERRRWRASHWLWIALGVVGGLAGLTIAGNRWGTLLAIVWSPGGVGPVDTSVQWRLSVLQWTWEMIRDHPWFGVGPGAFPVALLHYQRIPYVGGENPHNLYAEVAAEYGLPLAVLAILGLLWWLVRAARTARRPPLAHPFQSRRAALLGAVIAFAVHSATDLDWSYPAVALLAAVLLGLLGADSPRPPLEVRHVPWWRAVMLLVLTLVAGLTLARYYSGTLVLWGREAMSAGSTDIALGHLSRAGRLNPISTSALYWLAWSQRQAGDLAGALRTSELAVQIAPEDPNTHASAGELALAAGRWETAAVHFQRAVDLAPAAHLQFHAGLLDATAGGGKIAEAMHAYARAASLFTDARVLSSEARCLAPADRHLLARMSRLAARLLTAQAAEFDRATALSRAERLAQPDSRGICATGGRSGQTSPEAAVVSFWHAWGQGGRPAAERYVLSGPSRTPTTRAPGAVSEGPQNPRTRAAWIYSLNGSAAQATVVHQVERQDGGTREGRCARVETRFTPDGWYLVDFPLLGADPCRP